MNKVKSLLSLKKHYLQVALNSTLHEALSIVRSLPVSDKIILEVGTPLIKNYGVQAIKQISSLWNYRLLSARSVLSPVPYVVADLKCMDRGETEVETAIRGGAQAAVVLGIAPIETLNLFIAQCQINNLDSMVDMMNVDKPYQVLRKLKTLPTVVILHRGVDEEKFSDKPLPIHQINKVKGAFNTLVAVAGGDTLREVQSAVFNGADIAIVWKNFYKEEINITALTQEFLNTVK